MKVSIWQEKIRLATDIQGSKLLSDEWIYENIFNLGDTAWKQERENVITDLKLKFRQQQIENEGNDPAKTLRSFGTPHDLASLGPNSADGAPAGNDDDAKVGRPDIGLRYKSTGHPGGQDPIGDKDLGKTYHKEKEPLKHNFRGNSPLAMEDRQARHKKRIKSLKFKTKSKSVLKESLDSSNPGYDDTGGLLDENNIIDGTM